MFQGFDFHNYAPELRELVASGVPIFNDWWDTYIPEYKPVLVEKIIRAYYFNQIGAETPERFVWYINSQLERIMPYYNQLYASELIKINPLLNHSIESNQRTIENIIKTANTAEDRYAKAIRDFCGMTDTTADSNSKAHSVTTANDSENEQTTYEKGGSEEYSENTKINTTENETTDGNKNVTTDGTENTNENYNENKDTDTVGKKTENPSDTTTKEMNWGATENITEDKTGKSTSKGDGTRNWTETTDDDSTTNVVTDLDENTKTSSVKEYADTPQKNLGVDEDGNPTIRKDYLTNVTWVNDNSTHTANTTQDTTFQDDITKTHEEDTTDNNTTDTTDKTVGNKTKGGTDTETTTRGGSIVTDTTQTTNESTTGDKDIDTTIHKTENTTEHEDRNLEQNTNKDVVGNKGYGESGSGTGNVIGTHSGTTDTTGNKNDVSNTSTRETADNTNTSIMNEKKDSTETSDTGMTNKTSGYMNVSASALLEAFRKTFLNIDQMIIEELRDNFMLIY